MQIKRLQKINSSSFIQTNRETVNKQKITEAPFISIKHSTPLFKAIKNGASYKYIKELIDMGADINQSCFGMRPIQCAFIHSRSEDIIELLLD